MKKLLLFTLFCCSFFQFSLNAQQTENTAKGETFSLENALKTAVKSSYVIQLKQAAVQQAHARLRSVKGNTDVMLGASTGYSKTHMPYGDDPHYGPLGTEDMESDALRSSLWAQKTFSFGLQSKVSVDLTQNLDRLHGSEAAENSYKTTYGDKPTNRGTVSLELSLPLFKSFNAAVLANNIKAAQDSLRQLEFDLSDTVCKTVRNVADAYWSYLIAYNDVQQLEAMHERLNSRFNSMERLIQAGTRSKNDMLGMQVNFIENERNLVDAKIFLNNARTNLKQAIGMEKEPEAPVYSFPNIDFASINVPAADNLNEKIIENAAHNRPDIIALEKQLSAAQASLKAVIADSRPDAAVNFSIGSTGAVYGDSMGDYTGSVKKNPHGLNVGGSISFSMSVPNNAHKGAVESAQANCRQAEIQLTQAKTQLESEIRSTLYSLSAYRN
ncbi:MAG: TolC family protein, partial [Treponema sp.]|nr:TolC family protein [Treponema sp.]